MATTSNPISTCLTGLIRVYQYCLSPLLGHCCRFYPSCSHYAIDAIHTHGLFKGCFYAMTRLARCHPWHPGGVDLLPEKYRYVEQYD